MNPGRSIWMLASVALLAVGVLLGVHVYRLEARLASLEASSAGAGAATPAEGQARASPVDSTGRLLRLDDEAARQLSRRLGGELGLEQERVEKLTRFLMAFHLREALASARAQGEDISEAAASYPELLRGDLKQELRELRLTEAQLAALSRETPGLDALLSRQ
ncbi:hypothetical protein JQX13_19850 [Archangium violaceum]|uniref:hypothetical protein n=1 Tax=Archangium violaceum TaxID=83451 RepID=UPI00193B44E6|nr:hypothetical protein [Archangium violaceum]QRK12096.1 hypothetical protein JQX13_19850 [Archangium violaceum]